jgi:ABC-type Mn2+/Zn2+ transport system ATPase subunit
MQAAAAAPVAPSGRADGAGKPCLQVRGLSAGYGGELALESVSLQLVAGSICGLVGLNGAGKSTLFRTLTGVLLPSSGEIRIAGLAVAEAQRRQWVAYVPQADQLDWDYPLRVWDVVMMGRYGHMNLLRWPAPVDREAVREALRRVGLADRADQSIGNLSGGQRKRAFLARAIAQQARLLLLDEPFTGVDRTSEARIIDLLLELRADGVSVLIATHDLEAIPRFCDQVLLLNRRVLAFGPMAEVFTQANLLRTFGASPQLVGPTGVDPSGQA